MMDLAAVSQIVGGGVGVGTMLLVLVMLVRGDLVPGSTHRELREDSRHHYSRIKEDRDYWRDTAMEALNALGATVGRREGGV